MAAYNAAWAHIRVGAGDIARPLLERALQHDDLKAKAQELVDFLARPR
jgi:hypothetical protein